MQAILWWLAGFGVPALVMAQTTTLAPFTTFAPVTTPVTTFAPLSTTTSTTSGAANEIVLQACCNGTCTPYANPLDLFGLQCCGSQPVNLFNQICCNGMPHNRRKGNVYYEDCCGTQPLSWDETCCQGQVHAVAGQVCCGTQPYNAYDSTQLCCDGVLLQASTSNVACCGNATYDGGATQFCCGGVVYATSLYDRCCVYDYTDAVTGATVSTAGGYNSAQYFCCGGIQNRFSGVAGGYDGCCYVQSQLTPDIWTPTPFNSTIQCCDYSGVRALTGADCTVLP